jgi:CheY-like chemotaxis protein
MNKPTQNRILLVEDDHIIAMSEKITLEKYGYSVVTAPSGEKAIEMVDKAEGLDLVLMDIDLGKGIDGTQAAAEILSRHDIPIVFLSSHTEPEVVEKTKKITPYGYVVKNSAITVLDASIKMAFKLFYANKKTPESEQKYYFLSDSIPDFKYYPCGEGNFNSLST